MKMVLSVALDFDGVLNTYDGWNGANDLFEPRMGVDLFLAKLNENYNIFIFTVRNPVHVWQWLDKYNLSSYITDVTNHKPKCFVYVDDRGCKFEGDFDKTLDEINHFQAHWEHTIIEYVDSN